MSKATTKSGNRPLKNLSRTKTKRATKVVAKDTNNDGMIDEIDYKTVVEIPSPKKSTGKGKKITEEIIEKDLNQDGLVDEIDYKLVTKTLSPKKSAGRPKKVTEEIIQKDLNGDGFVDEIDYKMITKKKSPKKSMTKEKVEIIEKDLNGDGLADDIIVKKSTKKSMGKGANKMVTMDTEIEEFMMGSNVQIPTMKKSVKKSTSNLNKIAVINNSGKVVARPSSNKKTIPMNDVSEIPSLLVTIPYMDGDSNFELAAIKPVTKMLSANEIEKMEYAYEKELADLGYRSMGLHLVSNNKCYVKTVNDNGQKVFVCMDKANVKTNPSAMLMMETHHHSHIPYSVKHGTMETVGTKLHSVAFECINGVCMLSKNHDMDPIETNYGNMEMGDLVAGTKDSIIIPVLSIEEIRSNPKEVLHVTDEMTRKLRNNTYQYEVKELNAYLDSAKNLAFAVQEFDTMRLKISEQILDSLTLLEDWNDIYKSKPPTTPEGMAKYKLLVHNLTYRNNAIDTLLSMMNKVNESKALVDRATNIIKNATEHGYKEFKNIDSTLVD